jgi:polyisoprenoid-binding protein YceI
MTTTSTPFRTDAEVSAGYWIIDPTHSRIGFRVRNWIVTTVTGAFAEYDGALDWRNEAERSAATLSLSAASIGTGVDTRDAHLCSAHFFDVDRYPTITFSSTEIEPLGDGHYRFHGDLTIRDVTRLVVLDLRLERSSGADSEQQLRIGGHGCIDRHDFGLSYGPNAMISNLVEILIDVTVVRARNLVKAA